MLGLSTLDNASGHVVIGFVNNATVDERLLSYLESPEGGGLELTDTEKQALRPRIRMSARVTFADAGNSSVVIEFESGSTKLVDQNFAAQAFSDLQEGELINGVFLCDVASVEVDPGSDIEVYMPVQLTAYEMIEATTAGGVVVGVTYEPRERQPPGFLTLQVDDVDENGRVQLMRNIDPRDVPSPVANPLCGSVVVIQVDGVLTVPFFTDVPSYDREDEATEAGIGGRFKFLVSVQ